MYDEYLLFYLQFANSRTTYGCYRMVQYLNDNAINRLKVCWKSTGTLILIIVLTKGWCMNREIKNADYV